MNDIAGCVRALASSGLGAVANAVAVRGGQLLQLDGYAQRILALGCGGLILVLVDAAVQLHL